MLSIFRGRDFSVFLFVCLTSHRHLDHSVQAVLQVLTHVASPTHQRTRVPCTLHVSTDSPPPWETSGAPLGGVASAAGGWTLYKVPASCRDEEQRRQCGSADTPHVQSASRSVRGGRGGQPQAVRMCSCPSFSSGNGGLFVMFNFVSSYFSGTCVTILYPSCRLRLRFLFFSFTIYFFFLSVRRKSALKISLNLVPSRNVPYESVRPSLTL